MTTIQMLIKALNCKIMGHIIQLVKNITVVIILKLLIFNAHL